MDRSRRIFLKSLSALPIGVSMSSLAAVSQFSATKSTTSLAISFSGPLAFVMDGNDVTVYAPRVPNHFGRASTNDSEIKLHADANYQLAGLPNPTVETQMILPPLTLKLSKTPSAPTEFSIRLKRPDAIVGIRPMDVFLSNQPDRERSLPTGVRFLYKNISPDISLRLSSDDGSAFQPSFTSDRAAHASHLAMDVEFETPIPDHCHVEARATFAKLLGLFPGNGIDSIRFADESPTCTSDAAPAHLAPAIYQPEQISAHKLNINGRGGSCMSPVIIIKPH